MTSAARTLPNPEAAHQRLLELARARASRALLEAEGYSWFEITAARAEIARERPR